MSGILKMLGNARTVTMPILIEQEASLCKPTDIIPWPWERKPKFRELGITLQAPLDDARHEAKVTFKYGGFESSVWTVSYRALSDRTALVAIGMRAVREAMYKDTTLNLRNQS